MNSLLEDRPLEASQPTETIVYEVGEQLDLDLFTTHELKAVREHLLKKQREKEKRALRKLAKTAQISTNPSRSQAIDDISPSLLDAPLGPEEDQELRDLGDPFAASAGELYFLPVDDEIKLPWSETAIDQLHEGVVNYSLRLLRAKGNGKEKKEILRWIFDPHAMAYPIDGQKGKQVWRLIKASDVPFSFDLCCRIAGYSPDRLREDLIPVLKSLGLDVLFKEIEDAQQCNSREHYLNFWKQRTSSYGVDGKVRITRTGPGGSEIQRSVNIQYARGVGKGRSAGTEAGDVRGTQKRPVLHLRNRAFARFNDVLDRWVQGPHDRRGPVSWKVVADRTVAREAERTPVQGSVRS